MRTSLLLLAQSRSPPLDCGGLGGTLGISRPRGVFMFKRTRDLLTFANVCSFLALAVAISTGGAYAANTVFSTDIVNGEVKTPDLAASAVTSPKITDGGGQTADLADGGVTGQKVADSAVDGSKVADNSLGATDLGPSSVGSSEIATDAVGATEVADNSI